MTNKSNLFTDTRITGLLYLGLAFTGIFVFAYVKPSIYIEGQALLTKTNLLEKAALTRMGIAAELGIVVFQALAAMWFYKLFSKVNNFAAFLIAAFGMVNAVAILVSSAFWLGALNSAIANEPELGVYNLFNLHEQIWLVSGLFFGLWLIPMGYLALKAEMPRMLAWVLILGGVGYILSTYILILSPDKKSIAEFLPLLATVGEFWMIGYLLSKAQLHSD